MARTDPKKHHREDLVLDCIEALHGVYFCLLQFFHCEGRKVKVDG
jgi:hypothetical protein